jgi:alpha-ketoglutaric semialdehyde dehydrogenase
MNSIDLIIKNAHEAFLAYEKVSAHKRADFLDAIAEEIEALGENLIETASSETNLPNARFVGERARTCGQLRAFGQLLREGSWVNAVIETAMPDRQPLPRPDMRKVDIALGPIVVFGASNFPLAYSTAGGDTASALAAGCSVVVKGHPAHPRTSALVSAAILAAVEKCNMPVHTFQHVDGDSFEIGKALVQHPLTAGVGFTGSLQGGRAIFNYGQLRDKPIPVFAEMGSTNPVILLPAKLKAEKDILAKMYASSITMGVGQFCTNPGIILALEGDDLNGFTSALASALAAIPSYKMLHEGIHSNYIARLAAVENAHGVRFIYRSEDDKELKAPSVVATVTGADMLINPTLHEEVFGPSTLIVMCVDMAQLIDIWKKLEGQLTTSIIGTETELLEHRQLVDIAKIIAGRVVFNNAPTGVDVNHATVHGGPYPSTTDGRFTSVGMDAIKRWVRPVCFQDCPDALLPECLQNSNPFGLLRKVNGTFTRDAI